MYNHEPQGYICPFCNIVKGIENGHVYTKQKDIMYKDDYIEVYKCDGVSTRQHNEPSGNQDVWHYHLHVFPRYKNDNLYKTDRRNSEPEERTEYAEKLREYFRNKKSE